MRDVTSSEYIISVDEDEEEQWPPANGFKNGCCHCGPVFFSFLRLQLTTVGNKSLPFVGHTKQQAREIVRNQTLLKH